MERLWTPWRMEYIKRVERLEGCIFCDLPARAEAEDRASLILARRKLAFVIMNKFPYNSGHVMVAPFRHTADYADLTAEEHGQVDSLVARCIEGLRATMAPHGFNIGVNMGAAAGAGIADHVHVHVVPRWSGDTNFMTTVGEVKVLPQALDETWAGLAPYLK
ncbi:MAG: HIT domain-containing protein [Acidobacteria bacterium]|nr:HIT domain-containing protein [Acidobacteriota bacterium]